MAPLKRYFYNCLSYIIHALNIYVLVIYLNTKFIVIKLKNAILPAIFCLLLFFLLLFSKGNLSAAQAGLLLWANHVVPSVLPFFIVTELLNYTNVIPVVGRLLKKIMRPIFNVPGEGAYALIMGIIAGYPTGAKIINTFRKENICTKEEGERLLSFTNNSGPLFIVGTIGVSLFSDTRTGILLFITHLAASLTVGFLFRFWKYKRTGSITSTKTHEICPPIRKNATFSNLGEIMANSIMSSINTIVLIGGFVMLFSVIVNILNQSYILNIIGNILSPIFHIFNIPPEYFSGIITGIMELTNGVKEVANIATKFVSINVIICSFILGFGGISVLLQVFSITSKSDISIKPYIIGKFLQGCIAAFYTYVLLYSTPFFNLNL